TLTLAIVHLAAVCERVSLLGERAFGPVEVSVRTEVGAVEVVGAAGQRAAIEPLFALVRDAIAVSIRKSPNARRSGDVNGPLVPEAALREHHLIGEHDRFVEATVAVSVLETQDAVRWIGELFVRFFIRTGGVSDVEAAVVIKAGADGPLQERRPGDHVDIESGGNGEGLGCEFEFSGGSERRHQGDGDNGAEGEKAHDLVIARIRQDGQHENCLDPKPEIQPVNKFSPPMLDKWVSTTDGLRFGVMISD